jgi:PKD repeat protein
MNKKQIFPLSLTLLMVISILAFAVPVKAIPGIALYASPASYTGIPTDTYDFTVHLQNATAANMGGNQVTVIAFDLRWDTTKVNVTDVVYEQTLPGPIATWSLLIGYKDYATGWFDDITLGTLGTQWDVANSTVCKVSVEILDFTGAPGSVINITDMGCIDNVPAYFLTGDSPYDHTVYALTPPPTDPTADFTWLPLFPIEGVAASFDASASTAGFDGEFITPITDYYWDWENDGVVDDSDTDPFIDHTFLAAGVYTVNLTVYAPAVSGDPDPSYNDTVWMTHDVTVVAPALGRAIDLYTQDYRYPGYPTPYTGEGSPNGTQVDAFAPQDEVILCAKLTYNLEPIANKEVAFEIHGPENMYYNISIYRQAFTDEYGVACITFRIPWPDDHAEEIVFGTWTILAKASVAEVTIADWHWFEVGWIMTCGPIVLHDGSTPTMSFDELDTVYINVTVTNIALTPRNVTITVVIYDELGVPVASATMFVADVPPGTGTYTLTATIPEWAYVGTGMVYVNLYTALPWDCGVCYGPECSTPIIINPGP